MLPVTRGVCICKIYPTDGAGTSTLAAAENFTHNRWNITRVFIVVCGYVPTEGSRPWHSSSTFELSSLGVSSRARFWGSGACTARPVMKEAQMHTTIYICRGASTVRNGRVARCD